MKRMRAAILLEARFIGHREDDLATIEQSVERGDFETIARLGHNLRGNGPSYGFPELVAVGEGLEGAARSRDVEQVRKAATELASWVAGARDRELDHESGTQRIEGDERRRT